MRQRRGTLHTLLKLQSPLSYPDKTCWLPESHREGSEIPSESWPSIPSPLNLSGCSSAQGPKQWGSLWSTREDRDKPIQCARLHDNLIYYRHWIDFITKISNVLEPIELEMLMVPSPVKNKGRWWSLKDLSVKGWKRSPLITDFSLSRQI